MRQVPAPTPPPTRPYVATPVSASSSPDPWAGLVTGSEVALRFSKWDGSPHWESVATVLGTDEYGLWLAAPAGTRYTRPRAQFDCRWDHVMLVPVDQRFIATFNAHVDGATQVHTYVDITTAPTVSQTEDGPVVASVDMDLDVVRRYDATVFVDDEDEFEEHTAELAYPPELVAATQQSCDAVFAAVRDRQEPFADVAQAWLTTYQTT